jgi:hypothetical protein
MNQPMVVAASPPPPPPPPPPSQATLIYCHQMLTQLYLHEGNVDRREHLIEMMHWIEGFVSYV